MTVVQYKVVIFHHNESLNPFFFFNFTVTHSQIIFVFKFPPSVRLQSAVSRSPTLYFPSLVFQEGPKKKIPGGGVKV